MPCAARPDTDKQSHHSASLCLLSLLIAFPVMPNDDEVRAARVRGTPDIIPVSV
jgi:hypothetical protein